MQPQISQLIVNKHKGSNQYYDEILAEDVLPLRMMLIPSGTFLMGSPEGESGRQNEEGPQHNVTVPRFFMAKYPITQAQWRVVAALSQGSQKLKLPSSAFTGELRPVESVSWSEAVKFCDRLASYTNRQYRLPTEAEWEYACRAGTTTPFHFGETLSTTYANYNGANKEYGAYGGGTRGEYRGETTSVNHFEGANTFGLCDMHGNVYEWCQDHWHANYDKAPIDASAWLSEEGKTAYRVIRGGSWNSYPGYCRSAYRDFNGTSYSGNYIGFRVCCSAPSTLLSPVMAGQN